MLLHATSTGGPLLANMCMNSVNGRAEEDLGTWTWNITMEVICSTWGFSIIGCARHYPFAGRGRTVIKAIRGSIEAAAATEAAAEHQQLFPSALQLGTWGLLVTDACPVKEQ
jgi:hypothetical protein